MNTYFIKKGYKCNIDSKGRAIPYLDTKSVSRSSQVEVYKFAKRVMQNYNLENVLDVGCGFGQKLKEFIYPICSDITGVDTEHSINFCKKNYHFGKWFVDNIEDPSLNLNKKFDLIISSDVIEHSVDPDRLLSYIKKYSHNNTFIIVSTPERDLVRGKNSFGPPTNRAHTREWNMSELYEYINSRGFKILKHFLVEDYRKLGLLPLFRAKVRCQVILCTPIIKEK